MPHKDKVPPLPTYFERSAALNRRQKEVRAHASLARGPKPTGRPEERLLAALQPGAKPDPAVLASLKPAEPSGDLLAELGKALDGLMLPFDAIAEAGSSLIGAVGIGDPEKARRSRAIIGTMLSGDIDVGEAANLLRGVRQERGGLEQFATGVLFDPLNIIPGGLIAKSIRGSALAARAPKAASIAAGTVEALTGLPGAGLAQGAVKLSARRALRMIGLRGVQGLSEAELKALPVPRGASEKELEEWIIGKESVLSEAETDPDIQKMLAYTRSTTDSLSELRLRIFMETGARPGEVGRLRVRDVLRASKQLNLTGTSATESRHTELLSAKTLALLDSHIATLGDVDPNTLLFPTKTVKVGAPVGAKLTENQLASLARADTAFLNRLAKASGAAEGLAGGADKTLKGNIVRARMATVLAESAARQNAPLDVVQRFLGHSLPETMSFYVRRGLQLPGGEATNFKKLLEDDFPLSPDFAAEIAEKAARVGEAAAEARAAGAVAKEKRKSRTFFVTTEEKSLAAARGRAKIEALPVPDEKLEAFARLAEGERALLIRASQFIDANIYIEESRRLHAYLKTSLDLAPRKGTLRAELRAQQRAVEKSAEELARGAVVLYDSTLLKAGLDKIEALWKKAGWSGSTADYARRLLDAAQTSAKNFLDAPPGSSARRGRGGFPIQSALGKKALKALNEEWRADLAFARATGGHVISDLTDIADPAAQKEIVRNWLEKDGIKVLLRADGLRLEDGKFTVSTMESFRDLLGTIAKRNTQQFLFGLDFAKLSPEAKELRLNAIADVAGLNNLVKTSETRIAEAAALPRLPGELSARAKKGAIVETLDEATAPPSTPITPPTAAGAGDSAREWLEARVFDVPTMGEVRAQVHPSALATKWYESLLKSNDPRAFLQRRVADLLKAVVMRGGVAGSIEKTWIGGKQLSSLIFSKTQREFSEIMRLEGTVALRRRYHPETNMFDLGTVNLDEARKHVSRLDTEKGGRLRGFSEDELSATAFMSHQKTLVDPNFVPDAALRVVYPDLSDAEVGALLTLRGWTRKAKALAEVRMGREGTSLAKMLRNRGLESGDFFPTIRNDEDLLSTDGLTLLKGLSERELLPGSGHLPAWARKKKILDAAQAKRHNILYHDPWKVAERFVAEVQMYAVDTETLAFLRAADGKQLATTLATYNNKEDLLRLFRLAHEAAALGDVGRISPKNLDAFKLAYGERFVQEILNPKNKDAAKAALDLVVKNEEAVIENARRLNALTKGVGAVSKWVFEDPRQAQQVKDYFTEGRRGFFSFVQKGNAISSTLRFWQAGIDVSTLLIHGAPLLLAGATDLRYLRAYGKAGARMAEASLSPEVRRAFYEMHRKTVDEFTRHGGVVGVSEMTEGVASAPKIRSALGGLGAPERLISGVERVAVGANEAFTMWGDAARVYLWDALKVGAKTEDELYAVAAHVNKMTGTFNPAMAGMPNLQRLAEGAFISFAPMYRRAAYGLLMDVFRGGMRGELARAALGRLAAAGYIMFGVLPWLMDKAGLPGGNEKAVSPMGPEFLTFKLGDANVGLGTAYYSLVRAIVNVSETAVQHPEKLVSIDPRDQPLLKWLRSQTSTLSGGMLDLILGDDYIGDPLRGDDGDWLLPQTLGYAAKSFTPFSVAALFDTIGGGPTSAGLLGGAAGLRTFPVSAWRKRSILQQNLIAAETDEGVVAWREERRAAGEDTRWADMPKLLQQTLINRHPELQELELKVEADTIQRGRGDPKRWALYHQEIRKNRESVDVGVDGKTGILGISRAFESGASDSQKFRSDLAKSGAVLRALNAKTAAKFSDILTDVDLASLEVKLEELRPGTFMGDYLYTLYNQIVGEAATQTLSDGTVLPGVENEDGMFLPEAFETRQAYFVKKYGVDALEYVKGRRRSVRDLPETVLQYYDARELLTPYWTLHEKYYPVSTESGLLLDNYYNAPQHQQQAMLEHFPWLRGLKRRVDRLKDNYRREHPELDFLLAKFYGNTPITREAEERMRQWNELRYGA